MLKNLFLLALMTWGTMSYARPIIAHESMSEAENFKVEAAAPEHAAQRSLAGSKIKKQKPQAKEEVKDSVESTDSEVRYWQYSE
jgi:hypothetical protein